MRPFLSLAVVPVAAVLAAAGLVTIAGSSTAAQPPVGLGTAASFVVLAGSTITNTGPSVLNGDLGLAPGTATPGVNSLPGPATVNGSQHVAGPVARHAKRDLTTAYNDAAGRKPVKAVGADLTGRTLAPGIYRGGALGLTGTVTLNGHNNPAAVFVFQAASTLITASNSRVALIGVNPCNVYWQIGSSATLGTHSRFVGTVMALSDISATTGAVVRGRLLARNGAVTLDDNRITRPHCRIVNPSPTPPPRTSSAPNGSPTQGGGSRTHTAPGGATSSGSPHRTHGSPTGSGPATSTRTHGTGTGTTTTVNGPSTSTSPFGQPPRLARTGGDNAALIWGALAALVLGSLFLLLGRQRAVRARHRH